MIYSVRPKINFDISTTTDARILMLLSELTGEEIGHIFLSDFVKLFHVS